MTNGKYRCHGFCVVALLCLSACSYFVSWDDTSRPVLGHEIKEVTDLWGNADSVSELPNGTKEYMYHLKKLDPSCIHYWIVSDKGIVIDYRYSGRCRPIG